MLDMGFGIFQRVEQDDPVAPFTIVNTVSGMRKSCV